MKIYLVPVPKLLRPTNLPFPYPKYSYDWGVEQDFELSVRHSHALVSNPDLATHHYLPVYWTRYWVQNDYGKKGVEELNSGLATLNLDEKKLFTVCQYDDGPLTNLNFGRGLFLASRKTELGIDIPVIASPFPNYLSNPTYKRRLISFDGRISTHVIRQQMVKELSNLDGVYLNDRNISARAYYRSLASSYVALAPRGYGGSSFRFFEAMQVATVPALIGDIDTRPFKEFIDWNEISFYGESPLEIYKQVVQCSKSHLQRMGELAQKVYKEQLMFGKWTNLMWQHLMMETEIN